MILISWSRVTFFRTLSISSKIHDNAFSRLYNIFNNNFLSWDHKFDFMINLSILFDVNRASRAMMQNLDVKNFSNRSINFFHDFES